MEEMSRLSSGPMQVDMLRSTGSAQLLTSAEPAALDPLGSRSGGGAGAASFAGRQPGDAAFPADQSQFLLNPLQGHERYTMLRNLHRCGVSTLASCAALGLHASFSAAFACFRVMLVLVDTACVSPLRADSRSRRCAGAAAALCRWRWTGTQTSTWRSSFWRATARSLRPGP